MTSVYIFFLLAGLLLFVSVLANTLSARLGLPLLLLFLVVGMLAGEDGPGGIRFDDFLVASFVGHLALAIILLDGGLRTRIETFRVALGPAAVLASWGVVATVGLLGLFVTWLLDLDWRFGMLFAAAVGSTDAAAVFSLLRNGGVRLNERVRATLEIESGANDPMAILLVTVLVEAILMPDTVGPARLAWLLAAQLLVGAVAGVLGGRLLGRLMTRMQLPEGLYALLIVSGGLVVFAAANLLQGSGFLAVYLAGLLVGNRRCRATEHVLRVMDGLAWLAQATLFLVLGLLVTPSHLVEWLAEAVLIALFLMLVARPAAVVLGLLPFRYSLRDMAFISWVGLRGAVPIVLAIVPLMMGVPDSRVVFDITFAVVLVSLLVQGATVPVAARVFGVKVPPLAEPVNRFEFWLDERVAIDVVGVRAAEGAAVIGRHPGGALAGQGFRDARCLALMRAGERVAIDDGVRLQAGDIAWIAADAAEAGAMAALFGEALGGQGDGGGHYGPFHVHPDAPAAALAEAYGFALPADEAGLAVGELLQARLGGAQVEGDRLAVGPLLLTVRALDGKGRIRAVGLKPSARPAAVRSARHRKARNL